MSQFVRLYMADAVHIDREDGYTLCGRVIHDRAMRMRAAPKLGRCGHCDRVVEAGRRRAAEFAS